ncbi:helix-turn-helix domain-containing protein [Mycobacteroides franklinii]|uniref:XRE family transcriptional regulator n=1 Tax=Mycobacteroides franklinii TaxID=948102 RepID=A0A4R8QZL4_9MYCO|nr:helix-turn-helix domain-containing protein [Mycobacteroides franklinii]TDZ45782.1 hypothetical protein CCUG64054_01432 [Mycobacteroides franklinii]TDZ49272.1 hypothetical protein CCUG63697_03808 [Mycobacteroides franklinii]TDZ59452.1 hypothetical protein CCUG63696_01434 [Mycobacteroides franklinii]TDZ66967.1 hypothetical protein CCUG63695_00797 [Mycobacteroides franklinii]TDZ72891.1 hypothetical protein CCUG64056_01432 [Mycobacteroides franklinii]
MSVVDDAGSSDPTVGERIELRRLELRLSRRLVANLVGRSEEWLRLVETGRLRLDSVEVIMRLARALRIEDFRDLIDWPARREMPECRTVTDLLRPMRSAILDHPAINAAALWEGNSRRSQAAPAVDISTALDLYESIWSGPRGRYSQLAQQLPIALAQMRQHYWYSGGADGPEHLIRLYHLCRELCSRAGAHDLALIAADRGMLLAGSSTQRVVVAASAWHVADALIQWGRTGDGHWYALAAAAGLSSDATGGTDDDAAALRGALQLLAAQTAATVPDPAETKRLLAAAEHTAVRLGEHRQVHGVGFGRDEVGLTRMEAALACSDFDGVIQAASSTVLSEKCAAGRRARFHIMTARAFVGLHDEMGAAFELTKAADSSDEDLRYDTDAHRTLRSLLRRDNHLLRRDLVRLSHLAGFNGYAMSEAR